MRFLEFFSKFSLIDPLINYFRLVSDNLNLLQDVLFGLGVELTYGIFDWKQLFGEHSQQIGDVLDSIVEVLYQALGLGEVVFACLKFVKLLNHFHIGFVFDNVCQFILAKEFLELVSDLLISRKLASHELLTCLINRHLLIILELMKFLIQLNVFHGEPFLHVIELYKDFFPFVQVDKTCFQLLPYNLEIQFTRFFTYVCIKSSNALFHLLVVGQ